MLYPLSYGGGIEECAGQRLRRVQSTVSTMGLGAQDPPELQPDVAAVHVTTWISGALDDTSTAPPYAGSPCAVLRTRLLSNSSLLIRDRRPRSCETGCHYGRRT